MKGQWVFGGTLRSDPKVIFLEPVERRDKETLLEIIQRRIKPGTCILSDCWKSYDCLWDEGYTHFTVNHTYTFVDPDTGAHTQHIERAWREVRARIPRYGRKDAHFIGYLAEFMFKRSFPDHTVRLHEFLKAAANLYPPIRPST